MELIFKQDIIGKVENLTQEGLWIYGKIIPSELFQNYKKYFELLINAENIAGDTMLENDFFSDVNWFVKNDKTIKEISVPAVYPDGEIAFRYRSGVKNERV